jgi:acyl-CoA thioesterase I
MKKSRLGLLWVVVLSGLCGLVACTNPAGEQRGKAVPDEGLPWKLICLGDGLTAGVGLPPEEAYPAVLAQQLTASGKRVKIVNAGIKGETVAGANARIEWLLQQRFQAILLALGPTGVTGAEEEEATLAANWQQLFEKIRYANPTALVFVGSPAPYGITEPLRNFPAEGVLEKYQVLRVDLTLPPATESPDFWLPDGKYLSRAGHQEIALRLEKLCLPLLRE